MRRELHLGNRLSRYQPIPENRSLNLRTYLASPKEKSKPEEKPRPACTVFVDLDLTPFLDDIGATEVAD